MISGWIDLAAFAAAPLFALVGSVETGVKSVSAWILCGGACLLVLRLLIWMPFRRYEIQIAAYEELKAVLEAKVISVESERDEEAMATRNVLGVYLEQILSRSAELHRISPAEYNMDCHNREWGKTLNLVDQISAVLDQRIGRDASALFKAAKSNQTKTSVDDYERLLAQIRYVDAKRLELIDLIKTLRRVDTTNQTP